MKYIISLLLTLLIALTSANPVPYVPSPTLPEVIVDLNVDFSKIPNALTKPYYGCLKRMCTVNFQVLPQPMCVCVDKKDDKEEPHISTDPVDSTVDNAPPESYYSELPGLLMEVKKEVELQTQRDCLQACCTPVPIWSCMACKNC
ncbi:hypothetical protein CC80DRAFT_124782 [Byssothecium circinans]|uniref:Uncharacterized protein n=1 Tax=Byssothecium circinans TaxID=147558 RepID=A0A6A5TNW7_9PLEO|nr:hypothetical protein CC80DRAFT_124782 [Byssothecium circinans]